MIFRKVKLLSRRTKNQGVSTVNIEIVEKFFQSIIKMNGQKKLGSVYSFFSKMEGGDVKNPKACVMNAELKWQ